jgi:SAM-dependent methyltransferase
MQTRETYVKDLIRRRYRNDGADGEWGGRARAVRAGYDPGRLDALPAAVVERWAGCGNVVAEAPLTGVSVVVDLGAGAGLDGLLIAASPARPLVVAVDLSPEMLAAPGAADDRLVRVAGDFEQLPLADGVADLVIANAALNLALEPATAFAEAWRVLRPGGRLHICDLVRDGDLPPELLADPLAWSTSLGGVLPEEELVATIAAAGFECVTIAGHRPFEPVVAVRVDALKPAGAPPPALRGLQ